MHMAAPRSAQQANTTTGLHCCFVHTNNRIAAAAYAQMPLMQMKAAPRISAAYML
jgi:hypothetical protein